MEEWEIIQIIELCTGDNGDYIKAKIVSPEGECFEGVLEFRGHVPDKN